MEPAEAWRGRYNKKDEGKRDGSSMFEVSVEESFAAGHALRGYRGKCENPHGHNYKIRITVTGEQLDTIGLLWDFKDLKRAMNEIIERLDHQYLIAAEHTGARVHQRRPGVGDRHHHGDVF